MLVVAFLVACGLAAAMLSVFFPGGLHAWVRVALSYGYWTLFKRVSPDTSGTLTGKERFEYANDLAAWNAHETLNTIAAWLFFGGAVLVVFVWSFLASTRSKRASAAEHLRSGEQALVTPKNLDAAIRKAVRDKARPHTFRDNDVVFGKERIRVVDETIGLHLGIGGASQTGKTNAINQLLASRREAREKVLIVDPNGEFFARFGREGDVILSLHDTRAAKWDFWSEGVSEEELAKALVEVRDGMDASSKFFQTTGRAVLTSLLRIAKKAKDRLPELWRLANLPAEELESVLRSHHEISHRYLGQGDSGQAAGVIATSLMNLEFLKYLNHHASAREAAQGPEVSFSIRSWILDESDSRWVFLVASDSHWEQTRPLVRLWFDVASTAILERVPPAGGELTPLWLVCDELSTVGLLPSLPKVLDRGYKYRGRLVLGFQSLSQIQQIYGVDASANIMQGLQNLLIFACNETRLAREFSERLGRAEVEEYESSVSPAEGKNPMRVSFAARQRERVSVTADEIRGLPENVAYLKLARLPPTKIHFPYVRFKDSGERSRDFSVIPEKSWLDQNAHPVAPLPHDLASKERAAAVAPASIETEAKSHIQGDASVRDAGESGKVTPVTTSPDEVTGSARGYVETPEKVTPIPPSPEESRPSRSSNRSSWT
jgi:hypothetical protein